MSTDSRSIIVTGAASGIGAATADRLAQSGARVHAVDISEGKLADVVAAISSSGNEVTGHTVDVTDLSAMQDVVGAATDGGHSLSSIVACAGLADMSSVDSGNPARWREVLTVNALGPMIAARSVLPTMLRQGHGDIVVVTSASGRVTYVGEPAYVASKHAAVAFLDALRKELAETDIRVTSIEPGLVDTPMSREHPFIETIFSSVDPLMPTDIAGAIEYCLNLPRRVTVNEMVVRPTRQEL